MRRSLRKSATAAVALAASIAMTGLVQADDYTWGLDTPVFGPTAAALAVSEKCRTKLSQQQKLVLRSHLERLVGVMTLKNGKFAVGMLGLLKDYRAKYAKPENCTARILKWEKNMVVAIREKGTDPLFWQQLRKSK